MNVALSCNFLFFSSVTIILEPFLIAFFIKLFPLNLLPFIAKKYHFFTFVLSNAMPEKKISKFFINI